MYEYSANDIECQSFFFQVLCIVSSEWLFIGKMGLFTKLICFDG